MRWLLKLLGLWPRRGVVSVSKEPETAIWHYAGRPEYRAKSTKNLDGSGWTIEFYYNRHFYDRIQIPETEDIRVRIKEEIDSHWKNSR